MNKPLVYVIIVNWNGRTFLDDCLGSLLESTYSNTRFCLVDNGSSDDSVEYVNQHYSSQNKIEVLELGKNLGWSGANNAAIRHALSRKAEYLFLLNNDTVTDPKAIELLVQRAETEPEIGALAPKILFAQNPSIINSLGIECSCIGSAWDRAIGRLDNPRWDKSLPVVGGCGAALFIRAEALRRVGFFADHFGIYLDDVDLCLRLWNAGYRVETCPEAIVHHYFSATMGKGKAVRRKYYLNTRNRFWLVLRNFPANELPRILKSTVLAECKALGRAVIEGELWKVWAHVKSWVAALVYIPQAWSFRRSQKYVTSDKDRWWRLIRKDVLFFGGYELPENGFYRCRKLHGFCVTPIANYATLDVGKERLKLIVVNCYPDCGPTNIEIRLNSQFIRQSKTTKDDVIELETTPGELTFLARKIFSAEETGELVDFGGWVRIERTLVGDSGDRHG